jgi:hypothetical protein
MDPSQSEADIKTTRDLMRAGQLMRIELLDHIIIGRQTSERPKDWYQENSAPVHSENSGRVRASVWQTDDNGTTRYKITITRSYQEKDGAWRRGRTFFHHELAAVIEVIRPQANRLGNRRTLLDVR